jgi:hypothetical protein
VAHRSLEAWFVDQASSFPLSSTISFPVPKSHCYVKCYSTRANHGGCVVIGLSDGCTSIDLMVGFEDIWMLSLGRGT